MTESDQAERTTSTRRPFLLAAGLAAVVILIDQLTKWWAEARLGGGEIIPLGDFFSFVLVYNPGAAFSIGEEFTWVLTILSGIAAIGLAWYVWGIQSRRWALALGLLLGGAVTHFGDRLLRQPEFGKGHVVDFINYGGFFVGNVADIALFCGAALLLALSLFGISPRRDTARSTTG